MAEVIEYTLVVMVSVLFVAGSVYVYDSFSSFESQAQLRAASATVAALAYQAARNGSSSATVSLPGSTISCAGDILRLSTASSTDAMASPLACDFEVTVTGGTHTIQFYSIQSQLTIRVV